MTTALFLPDRVIATSPTDCAAHGGVLVADGLVVGLGTREELLRVAPGAVEVPLPGCSVVPGFIDAHVHLAFDGSTDAVARCMASSEESLIDVMARNARSLLRAGVTTARDLGAPGLSLSRLLSRVRESGAFAPDLVFAHAPITTPNGHLAFMGGGARDVAEALSLIDEQAVAGARWAKIMVNGGFTTSGSSPWHEQFSLPTLQAMVAHAHHLGLRAAAHVHSGAGIELALDAGFDTLEHCTWLKEPADFTIDARVSQRIAETATAVCPTIAVNTQHSKSWVRRKETVLAMLRAGIPIIAGTDAGIPDTPHGDYAAGLQAMTEVPMLPQEILRAATVQAASALGLSDRGSLSPGERADLVVLRGDPLADPAAFASVEAVYLRGIETPLAEETTR
ncbi:amidohydrolase family protein [Streptomyces sp. NPDC091217]|uniref:amidohydrolase family protein n=1 Tax=Streptomyces sp. NPDC091217 TaxID=3365975 RepID=UPI003812800C